MDYHAVINFYFDNLCFFLLAIDIQNTTFLAFLLIALLALAYIISGAEVALFSLSSKDINMLKTKQHSSARRIVSLLEESKEVYTSLLIAGTFINICIIFLANYLINRFIPYGTVKGIDFLNLPVDFWIELFIRVGIIGFIIIFIGNVLPKIYATQYNLRFAYGASYVVEGIHLLLRKISIRMVSLAESLGRGLGGNISHSASLQELDQAIDITTDEETSLEEKNILKGIVKFGDITVKQVMRSRLDVSGIDYSSPFSIVLKKAGELHYSRLPVYKGNLDEVVGVINTKDLLPWLKENANFDWHPLMRQPFFVPENKFIEDLLKTFQAKRIHFAIVVDEFGGTSGIVTMEDILEEIIGEIKDEFDEEEQGVKKLDEYTYIFEGKTMIHDLCKIMKLPLDTFDKVRGESESVGGLVLELAGEFPILNAAIRCGDFEFTVLETFKNRILQVKVAVSKAEPED